MAKRFGRNQKRALKKQITDLIKQVAYHILYVGRLKMDLSACQGELAGYKVKCKMIKEDYNRRLEELFNALWNKTNCIDVGIDNVTSSLDFVDILIDIPKFRIRREMPRLKDPQEIEWQKETIIKELVAYIEAKLYETL